MLALAGDDVDELPEELNALRMRAQEDFPSFGEPDDLANFGEVPARPGRSLRSNGCCMNRGFGIEGRQTLDPDGGRRRRRPPTRRRCAATCTTGRRSCSPTRRPWPRGWRDGGRAQRPGALLDLRRPASSTRRWPVTRRSSTSRPRPVDAATRRGLHRAAVPRGAAARRGPPGGLARALRARVPVLDADDARAAASRRPRSPSRSTTAAGSRTASPGCAAPTSGARSRARARAGRSPTSRVARHGARRAARPLELRRCHDVRPGYQAMFPGLDRASAAGRGRRMAGSPIKQVNLLDSDQAHAEPVDHLLTLPTGDIHMLTSNALGPRRRTASGDGPGRVHRASTDSGRRRRRRGDELVRRLDGLRTVRVAWADQHGLVRGKTLPVDVFRSVLRNGMRVNTGPAIMDSGSAIAFNPFMPGGGFGSLDMMELPDVVCVPDPLHLPRPALGRSGPAGCCATCTSRTARRSRTPRAPS